MAPVFRSRGDGGASCVSGGAVDTPRITQRPSSGPGSSHHTTQVAWSDHSAAVSEMAGMVSAKPTAFMTARVEPTRSRGALAAASAENWGESAMTVIPQRVNSPSSTAGGSQVTSG